MTTAPQVLTIGDIEVRVEEGRAMKGGEQLSLTKSEFHLLTHLAQNPNRVWSRDQLLDHVWGYANDGDGRLVDTHVARLRAKIEDNPTSPTIIHTVRGLGYRLSTSGIVRLRPQGLRARSAAAFALLALLLSVTLSFSTYQLARWYLLEQRESLATRQAIINALVAKGVVTASEPGNIDVLESLRSVSNARAVLRVGDTWYAAVVELSEATIPATAGRRCRGRWIAPSNASSSTTRRTSSSVYCCPVSTRRTSSSCR